jgi:PP-loop superfamily ATP-utilizing enzyme
LKFLKKKKGQVNEVMHAGQGKKKKEKKMDNKCWLCKRTVFEVLKKKREKKGQVNEVMHASQGKKKKKKEERKKNGSLV